jgi:beta-glucosidase
VLSHLLGIHAPGYRDIRAASRAMHHVMLAHGTGDRRIAGRRRQKPRHCRQYGEVRAADRLARGSQAAELGDAIFNQFFLGAALNGFSYPSLVTDIIEPYLPKDWQADMPQIARPLDWVGCQLLHPLALQP